MKKLSPKALEKELRKRMAADSLKQKKPFVLEEFCFDKQLAFIQDPARFKTAVCSRRCLAAGTLVQTELGPVAIEQLKAGDRVYDEYGSLVVIKEVFYNGLKTVVELKHGKKVIAKSTLDHVFLTRHNRIKQLRQRSVKDLYPGIRIVRNEVNRDHGISVPYAYAIGALLGDGCSRQGGLSYISISSQDDKIPKAVKTCLQALTVKKQKGKNYTYNIYADSWPEEYKLWCDGKYAHEKTCDIKRILSWDRQSRLAFVAGLLDTDGSVHNAHDGLQIDISMQAKPVIEALQILLLDLWQLPVSIIVDNRSKYKNGPVYCLRFKHNYFGKKVLKELTPFLQTDHKKFKSCYEDKLENNYCANGLGVVLGKETVEPTYDIHVDSPTNLYMLANGLITHNSGKSVACAADLIHTASTKPGDVLYLTLNRRSAKRIIWRELLRINKEYNINAKPDNTDLTLTMPAGNMIHVSGAKDEAELEKYRGMALRKVYIDEAQSFRPYIKELIEDIIEPALTDYYGSLVLIGTPGPIPSGYFYDITHADGWSKHHWTMMQNPFIQEKSGKPPLEIIQELAARRGLTLASPSIQREYFGQWVRDVDSLVFHFDPNKNLFDGTVPSDTTYIFGIDIGYNDADAIAVLGYSPMAQCAYLVHEYIATKTDISTLVAEIKRLQSIYNPVKMVMDAGALGKKIQEEIRLRHGLHLEAAEKVRKAEFIALLNDDLRTGKFKALPGSRFEQDAYLLNWDLESETPKVSKSYHSDIADSALYSWREARHFYPAEPIAPILSVDEKMIEWERREAEKIENAKKSGNQFTDVTSWDDLGIDDIHDDGEFY